MIKLRAKKMHNVWGGNGIEQDKGQRMWKRGGVKEMMEETMWKD